MDQERFAKSYSFITDLQRSEVGTLKAVLIAARKTAANAPRDVRAEKEAEVSRIERALKRAESGVQRAKREETERTALREVSKEEKMKRADGKGNWWMKKCKFCLSNVRQRKEGLSLKTTRALGMGQGAIPSSWF